MTSGDVAARLERLTGTGVRDLQPAGSAHRWHYYRAALADGRAVSVESAGTGDWHVGEQMFGPARAELARRSYDGSAHRARQIQPSWLPRYDLVVAMDRANLAALQRMAPDADSAGRIRLLRTFDPALPPDDPHQGEVPDPFGGGAEDYALAFDLVLAATTGLAEELAALPGMPAHERT